MAKNKLRLSKAEQEEIQADFKDLKERLVTKYAARNKRIEDFEEHRWKRNPVSIPSAYEANVTPYHSPLCFDYARRVPAIFGNPIPQVSVPPARPGAEPQKDSSDAEIFWQGFVERLLEERDLRPKLKDSLPNAGGVVIKHILKRDDWFSPPEQEKDEQPEAYNKRVKDWRKGIFPFTWDHVPTTTFYPVIVNSKLLRCVELTRREAKDIAKKYGLSRSIDGQLRKIEGRVGSNNTSTGDCEWGEWFDENRYGYFVDDELVECGRTNYGMVPYSYAPAAPSSSNNPEDEWLPFGWPLVSMQDELETAVNMYKNWAYMNAYPTPIIHTDDPNAVDRYDANAVFTLKPGEGQKLMPGYKLDFAAPPGVHGDLKGYLDRMDREAEMLALASILQGTGPGAGTPGVTAAMQLTVAHSMFDPAGEAYAHMWDNFYRFVMKVIDNVLIDPVAVWRKDTNKWVERGADDIKGYYRCKHSMNPVIPAEKQLDQNAKLAALQNGVGTKAAAIEAQGYQAPEEVLRDIYIEKKLEDPRVDDIIMKKVFERLGIGQPVPGQGTPKNMPTGVGGAFMIPEGNPQGPQAAMADAGVMQ